LDPDQVLAECLHRLVGEPVVEQVLALLAGVDLHPGDLAASAVSLLYRRVEHPLRGAPDVGARSVSLDERQDRLVGDGEAAAGDGDCLAILRDLWRWAGHVSALL